MRCGTDICSVERMQESIEEFGDKFITRIFTPEEIKYCEARKIGRYECYAARFAGKEAVFKALAPEKECEGVFTEVEILNDRNGRPYAILHGVLADCFPEVAIDVSLSHEREFAIAMAVVS